MPVSPGGKTPPERCSGHASDPFGLALIHCYSLKSAEMRAFLAMGWGVAFKFDPPTPALRGGRVRIT